MTVSLVPIALDAPPYTRKALDKICSILNGVNRSGGLSRDDQETYILATPLATVSGLEYTSGSLRIDIDNAILQIAAAGLGFSKATANTVLSGPTSGGSTTPTFRSLVDADIPSAIARDSEVTSAVAALSSVYQPLDSDLTAIAALSTTSYGRSLLTTASLAALVAAVKAPVALFDHYTDAGNTHTDGTEDDLYSDTLAAGQFATNGDKVEAEYELEVTGSATASSRIRAYLAGTLVWDSGALTLSAGGSFFVFVQAIRESSSVLRCVVSVTTTSASTVPYTTYTRITSLALSNTQVLKLTGTRSGVGAAASDCAAKMGTVSWRPAA